MPTLRLGDYLQENLVLWDLPSLDKSSFIKDLVARVVAVLPAVDEQELLDRLLEREAQITLLKNELERGRKECDEIWGRMMVVQALYDDLVEQVAELMIRVKKLEEFFKGDFEG